MKRNPVLLCLFIALAVLLLLCYSLMGAMTGVYRCPIADMDGPAKWYLLHRDDGWHWIDARGGMPDQGAIPEDRWSIDAGVWSVTLIEESHGITYRAYAPWNPLDVWRVLSRGRAAASGGASSP